MAINQQYELLESVEKDVRSLMQQHQARRKPWHFHDFIPWEQGRNFIEEPWEESQCTISPIARTSLVLNLLTEDNLPCYHEAIGRFMLPDSAFCEWTRLWTAEEAQHAIAMRTYLLTTRNCDPAELETSRMATMTKGYAAPWADPLEAFAYTSAQELATRVSHRNAGKITDDATAFQLMKMIASDENHHFLFYRSVMSALLRENASLALAGIHRVFTNFEMPGACTPKFRRRSIEIAQAGVYNLRVHHDHVLIPLIREWDIAGLAGLTPKGAEYQEKILQLPATVLQGAEAFEKRMAAKTLRSVG
jgi:acyl-[acyl-carrier-protein] desaturase